MSDDEIAATHGLTSDDAVYLELALRRGIALATHDKALSKAMSDARVAAALPAR